MDLFSKIFLLVLSLIFTSSQNISAHDTNNGIGQRVLMSFKETPSGSNFTFECSPSGPCVACPYSEKNDDKYRCSETGNRIPLKCEELKSVKKDAKGEKGHRRLTALEYANIEVNTEGKTQKRVLGDTSTTDHKSQAYITYRSCVPAVNEKLSVLGFEGVVLILLSMSGSFLYFRRKQNNSPSANGAVRIPTSSRF